MIAFLRTFLTILAVSAICWSANAQEDRSHTLLWRISGNGLTAPSYLYGTMHVSNKIAFHLSDSFFVALEAVDKVALEQDPGKWMDELIDSDFIKMTLKMATADRTRFRERHSYSSFYDYAFRIRKWSPHEVGSVVAYEPDMVNGLLYRFRGHSADFEENTYLDLFIYQASRKMGKQVIGLEDFIETLEIGVEASRVQAEEYRSGKISLDAAYRSNLGDAQEQLQNAYRKGDLQLLDSLNQLLMPSPGYRGLFLYKRNEIMVEQIDSVLKNHSLFAGVGAAHLPGEQGMLQMLRDKGYTVSPVMGKITNKAKKRMAKLQAMEAPTTPTVQQSHDGQVSFSAATSFFESPRISKRVELLATDMANGSYNLILRKWTYGALTGRSTDDLYAELDSLLYEFVPGTIEKQTKIEVNGFHGYEVTNRTTRGDIQRQRIIVTPLELLVFKLNGTGDYWADSKATKCLESVNVEPDVSNDWRTVSSALGGFSVDVPGMVVTNDPPPNMRYVYYQPEIQAFDQATNNYFLVKRTVLHDLLYLEEDTFELAQLARSFGEKNELESVSGSHKTENGYPVYDSEWKLENGKPLYVQTRLQGPFYYLLVAQADARPDQFFDSFALKPLNYDKPFETVIDSAGLFSSLQWEKPSGSKLAESMLKIRFEPKEEELEPEEEWSNETTLSSPNGEQVLVTTYKFVDFDSEASLKVYFDFCRKEALNDSSLVVLSETRDTVAQTLHLVLGDTNTIRTIECKYQLRNGVVYYLGSLTDSLTGTLPFAKAVFESFEPLDTVVGKSLFDDKHDLFLTEYFEGDSARREKVLEYEDWVWLKDKHFDRTVEVINELAGNPDHHETRFSMISSFSEFNPDLALPYLEKLYYQAGDTTKMQLAILSAVGWTQTKESSALFLKLLQHAQPFVEYPYQASDLFYPFADSLELAKPLFPALLKLTRNDDYKRPIYRLLGYMAAKDLTTPQMYGSYKEDMIADAIYEQKKQQAADRSKKADALPYSRYSDDEEGSSLINYELMEYVRLLSPYKNEPKVAKWLEAVKSTKVEVFQFRLYKLWQYLELEQPDTLLAALARNDYLFPQVYRYALENDQLDLLPKELLTQRHAISCLLYGQKEIEPADSLTFVDSVLVNQPLGKSGYLYLFKRKHKEKDYWLLDYCGLQPANTAEINVSDKYCGRGLRIGNEDDSLEELIEELRNDVQLVRRERMAVRLRGSSYSSYD